jgi:hypothetical protein
MLGEWARNVATLSTVNRVLLASGQHIVRRQMELAQDMMADTREARVLRAHRPAIAFGAKSVSVLQGSNCRIAAIVGQHLMKSIRGLVLLSRKTVQACVIFCLSRRECDWLSVEIQTVRGGVGWILTMGLARKRGSNSTQQIWHLCWATPTG